MAVLYRRDVTWRDDADEAFVSLFRTGKASDLDIPPARTHGGVLARQCTLVAPLLQSACDHPRLIEKSRQAGECIPRLL